MRLNRHRRQRSRRHSWRYKGRHSRCLQESRREGARDSRRRPNRLGHRHGTTPAERGQLQEETSEDCCVCYEALGAPMVCLGSCPHRLHLPCYVAFRVRAGTNLRCPACRMTGTVNEADRLASRQHSNEVVLEALSVAQNEMPADGGGGAPTRTTMSERERRAICSIYHGVIEETTHVQVSCSCDVHRRCALGFVRTLSPEPGTSEEQSKSRARTRPCTRSITR